MKKIILADQKLNQLVDDITSRLMQDYQFQNGSISGAGITEFCRHSQVNQFILFRIYQDWNAQISQLVHPYFDFGAAEVKEGLRRFLNLLSGHIRVQEIDFEPLVRSAVFNSLKLILNPEDAIGKFFFLNTEAIPVEVYRKHAPYFSDFDFVIQAILKYHDKNDLQVVERAVFMEKFGRVVEIWEGKEGKSISEYQRGLFKDLTGKELDEVVGKDSPAPEVVAVEEEAVEQNVEEVKAAEDAEERKRPVFRVNPSPKKEEPAEEQQPVSRESKTTLPPWVDQPTAPPPATEEPSKEPIFASNSKPPRTDLPPWVKEEVNERNKPETVASVNESAKDDKPKNLLDQFAQNRDSKGGSLVERSKEQKDQQRPVIEVRTQKPVVEQPPREEQPVAQEKPVEREQPVQRPSLVGAPREEEKGEPRTLADRFKQQSSPIGHDEEGGRAIKAEQIPVHKQFQFVQKVFGGSSVKFKVVLDKINKTTTLDEATEVLEKYVFNDPNVNRNDKVSKEFVELVRAKFDE